MLNTEKYVSKKLLIKYSIIMGMIGTCLIIYFIFFENQEKYSILYILPESYSNYISYDENISFVYGIGNFEKKIMVYDIVVYLDGKIIKKEKVRLKNREIIEKKVKFKVTSDIELPAKVKVVAITSDGKVYSTYFWIKRKP